MARTSVKSPSPRLFMPNKLERLVENHFKSNKDARVFGQLYYWSSRMPDGFYKFKEPCKHRLYKKGDSWSEDLNMTKRVFQPVFSRFVNYHQSKTDYRKSTDKFGGKMFCSYTERNTNKTYYFMDKEAVEGFLASLTSQIAPSPSRSVPTEVVSFCQAPKNMSSPACSEVPNVVPLTCAHQTAINTQTITSLDRGIPSDDREVARKEEELSSKEMVSTWNSHLQDKVVWYPSAASRLYRVLADFFGGCLETFKKYCAAIANTNFLMGKAPNSTFKAFFYWAIKPEVIKSIFQGAYGVKDILSKISNVPEEDKLKNEYETISYKIQAVNSKIFGLKNKNSEDKENYIRDHQQTISEEAKDIIQNNAQQEVDKEYPTDSVAIRNVMLSVKITDGLDKLKKQFRDNVKFTTGYPKDIVVPQELLDEKKRLDDRRNAVESRLYELHVERQKVQTKINNLIENIA